MRTLAIDSATEVLGVALSVSGGQDERGRTARIYVATRDVGLRHSPLLMPIVDGLLREAGLNPTDLDLVVCSRGPGSFTGLRIGMSTCKGIAVAIAASRSCDSPPLVSVPTLDIMAHGSAGLAVSESSEAPGLPLVVPVIDGRKKRFYSALFRNGRRITGDLDLPAVEIARRARQESDALAVVTGPHAPEFLASLPTTEGFLLDPLYRRGNARSLIQLGEIEFDRRGPDEANAGPVYVRGSDAELARKD